MHKYIINGGRRLFGTLEVSSAKNAFLPIIAGSLLSSGQVVLHKCPDYTDIASMCRIIESLGCKAAKNGRDLIIDSSNASGYTISEKLSAETRGSVFALGAILGKNKAARVAYPGGCAIGKRPIDLHLMGLRDLGVLITEEDSYVICDGSNMRGGVVRLSFPSVGATENMIMAAVLARGTTEIIGAACEPEVEDLANFLNHLGAKINGAGTSHIIIEGVNSLGEGEYTPISDRITAGTYLIACAMAGGKITLSNFNPQHNRELINILQKSGCQITVFNDKISMQCSNRLNPAGRIETRPYPGFPTDLQPQLLAMQCVADGISRITENLFESRFGHIPELIKMGADITFSGNTAYVTGVNRLTGTTVSATDLRCGAALTLAGLAAVGQTTVLGVGHIERGYENLDESLRQLGADVTRI
ncbi:MAG: UDP-N-acetylglucosamine 1-carboxyvinyltransferase [Firmicutes bacterium]|nr:UDP-N-acetylglucosamine 1-carboxyvinyltransferase [Bacillota bacterium]